MAKHTKRRHVRRTRKHGKRRGTRRYRGREKSKFEIISSIATSVAKQIGFSSNKVGVAPSPDTRKHKPASKKYGNKVAPIAQK